MLFLKFPGKLLKLTKIFCRVKISILAVFPILKYFFLVGRSTVFDAMFHHDTLEAEKNKIHISDIDFDVLQELLRFIYCGSVSNLETVAIDLLSAADKYGFLDLKNICQEYLMEHFQVSNSLEVLTIADLHDCPKLKSEVVHFIGRFENLNIF